MERVPVLLCLFVVDVLFGQKSVSPKTGRQLKTVRDASKS
jgi:hypothetical protein